MVFQLKEPGIDALRNTLFIKAQGYEDIEIEPCYIRAQVALARSNMQYKICKTSENHFKWEIAEFAHSAFTQLLTRLRIPTCFYRRNPSHIQETLFNYWKAKHVSAAGPKNFLFRLDHTQAKNHVRAVMSDKYGIIDDVDLFKILFEVLEARSDVSYRLLQYDTHITQLFVDFNDAQGIYNGQNYTASLCITNSETGHSSVWIEPVVHCQHYSFFNRHALQKQGVDLRIIHRGEFARNRLSEMVAKAKEIAQIGVIQLAEQSNITIKSTEAIDMVKCNEAFPGRFVALLEEEWSVDEDIIKIEAAQRILILAQELPLFQRIRVQQNVGKTLGLFTNYKDRFSNLVLEINDDQQRTNDAS